MLALLYNNTSVYTNILSCRRGRVEDEIPTYKTEYLYIPSICTIKLTYLPLNQNILLKKSFASPNIYHLYHDQ